MLKQYIKLFALINAFFLFYALGITWEKSQVDSGTGYYGGFFCLDVFAGNVIFSRFIWVLFICKN